MNTSTSNKFKVFSFVFTLIMILYHAQWDFLSNTPYVSRLSTITEKGLDHLAGVAMAYFFMTSGFMLYNNLTSENVGNKLKRRIKNLLIPFILWNMIYMPLKIFFMHQSVNGIFDLMYHFSFAPYAGPLWYVFAVFILSLFSPFIIKIRNRSVVSFGFCILILLTLSLLFYGCNGFKLMGYSEDIHFIMWLSRLCRYMPAYIVGGVLGIYHNDASAKSTSRLKIGSIILLLFGLLLWFFVDLQNIFRQLFLTIEPILLWMIVDESNFYKTANRIVKNSFLMYAIHFLVIYAIRVVVMAIVPSTLTGINALLVWIMIPIITVVATYFASNIFVYIMNKINLNKVFNVLTGGRT